MQLRSVNKVPCAQAESLDAADLCQAPDGFSSDDGDLFDGFDSDEDLVEVGDVETLDVEAAMHLRRCLVGESEQQPESGEHEAGSGPIQRPRKKAKLPADSSGATTGNEECQVPLDPLG